MRSQLNRSAIPVNYYIYPKRYSIVCEYKVCNCFQVNKGIQAVYSDANKKLESLCINGNPVQEEAQYSVCLQEYHYKNSLGSLNLTAEELGNPKVVATSVQDVLEEYLSSHQLLDNQIEGRLVYK